MRYSCNTAGYDEKLEETFKGDKDKIKKWKKDLPSFSGEYQTWYSEAYAVVKQVLPDRIADFSTYYEYPRVRKDISFENYRVKDFLQGLRVTRGGYEVVVDNTAAIPAFVQQLNIVRATKAALSSVLLDLKTVLQADLFDSEVDTANALAKAGYIRGAGAICGVVIEKHLIHVCGIHGVIVRKKNPGISDLNQLLRNEGTLTCVPSTPLRQIG